jgi:hypothetical protein
MPFAAAIARIPEFMMGRRGFISRGPGSYRYKPARPYHVAFADSYMREAQEKISARMLGMLCLTFKTLRAEIAAGLAQSLQEGQGRASARARRGKRSNRILPRQRRRYPPA